MADDRIVDYIRTTLASGYSSEQIRQLLIQAGNPAQQVDEAFSVLQLQQNQAMQNQSQQSQPQSYSPTDQQNNNAPGNQNPVQSNDADQTSENASRQNQETSQSQQQPSQQTSPSDKTTAQTGYPSAKSKDFLSSLSSLFGVKHFNPVYITIVLVLFLFIVPLSLFILIPESSSSEANTEGSRVEPNIRDNLDDVSTSPEPEAPLQNEDAVSEERTSIPTSSKGRCRIFANELALQVAQGSARGLFVSGYASENEIHKITWEIGDETIASIMPKYGTYTAVTGKNPGSTNIVVTDTAVGPECTYTISVTVE